MYEHPVPIRSVPHSTYRVPAPVGTPPDVVPAPPYIHQVLRSGAPQAEDDQAEEDSDQPAIGPHEEPTQVGPSPVCPRAYVETSGNCQEPDQERRNHGSRCSSEAGDSGSHACSVLDETASTVSSTATTIASSSSSKTNLLLDTAGSSPGGSAADLAACELQAGGASVLKCTGLDTDKGSEGAAETDDVEAVNDGEGAGDVASPALLSGVLGLRAVRDGGSGHSRVAVVARKVGVLGGGHLRGWVVVPWWARRQPAGHVRQWAPRMQGCLCP